MKLPVFIKRNLLGFAIFIIVFVTSLSFFGYKILNSKILSNAHAAGNTYYVNEFSGSNSNDGSSSVTAWKSIEYAIQMLTAGDTLNVLSTSTQPSRGTITTPNSGSAGNPITIQGTSNTSRASFIGSRDVSHGSSIGDLIKNGNFEGWLSPSSLWGITSVTGVGTGSFTKETVTARDGASGKLVRSGSTIFMRWNMNNLPAGTSYTFSYWHRETAANYRFKYTIQEDLATDNYLQADGSWSPTSYTFDPADNSNGVWKQVTNTFTTNAIGNYFITVQLPYDTTSYIDDVSLVPVTNSFQWLPDSGNIYRLYGYLDTPRAFSKTTSALWNTDGVISLKYVPRASSLAAIAKGEWWYENNNLYYNLDDGETIDSLHLEAGSGSGISAISSSGNYYIWRYFNQYMSNQFGISLTGNNNLLENSSFNLNYSIGIYSTGASNIANDIRGAYTWAEDIFEVDAGDFTCNRCIAEKANDDGFQAINTGQLTVNYSISKNNGLQKVGDNSGFGVEGAGAKMYLYNSVAYDNFGRGIQVGINIGYEVKNNISWNSDFDVWTFDSSTESAGIHTNNIFKIKSPAWTTDSTEKVNVDPMWVDPVNYDFELQEGSPAIDAGVDVNLTSDFAGTSVPQGSSPDIGAYEFVPVVAPTSTPTPTEIITNVPPLEEIKTLVLTIIENHKFNTQKPQLTGKAPAGSKVEITVNSTPQTGIVTADSNGNWSWTPPNLLENEEHSYKARIVNGDGTFGEYVGPVKFMVNTSLSDTGGNIGLFIMIGVTIAGINSYAAFKQRERKSNKFK